MWFVKKKLSNFRIQFFHFYLTDRFRSRVWWWVTSRISLLNWFLTRASLMAQQVKNLPAVQETQETRVQFLGQEDPPWGGDVNMLKRSCLESAMDRGASWTTVHGVAKSLTGLRACMCVCTHMWVRVHTHTQTDFWLSVLNWEYYYSQKCILENIKGRHKLQV